MSISVAGSYDSVFIFTGAGLIRGPVLFWIVCFVAGLIRMRVLFEGESYWRIYGTYKVTPDSHILWKQLHELNNVKSDTRTHLREQQVDMKSEKGI